MWENWGWKADIIPFDYRRLRRTPAGNRTRNLSCLRRARTTLPGRPLACLARPRPPTSHTPPLTTTTPARRHATPFLFHPPSPQATAKQQPPLPCSTRSTAHQLPSPLFLRPALTGPTHTQSHRFPTIVSSKLKLLIPPAFHCPISYWNGFPMPNIILENRRKEQSQFVTHTDVALTRNCTFTRKYTICCLFIFLSIHPD